MMGPATAAAVRLWTLLAPGATVAEQRAKCNEERNRPDRGACHHVPELADRKSNGREQDRDAQVFLPGSVHLAS
jgi:hypothetical protein